MVSEFDLLLAAVSWPVSETSQTQAAWLLGFSTLPGAVDLRQYLPSEEPFLPTPSTL